MTEIGQASASIVLVVVLVFVVVVVYALLTVVPETQAEPPQACHTPKLLSSGHCEVYFSPDLSPAVRLR